MRSSSKNKPITVLHVFGGLDIGGSETLIMNLMREIPHGMFRFMFVKHVSSWGAYEEEIKNLGCDISVAPKFNGLNYFEYRNWWKRYFDHHKEIDIVHAHMRSTASIYLRQAKRNGLITIAHSHNSSDENGFRAFIKSIMYRGINDASDARLACSVDAGRWLFGDTFLAKENDAVFPNAINTQLFKFDKSKRQFIRKALQISPDAFVLGNVGRFVQQKNHQFLLEVFSKFLRLDPSAILVMVGDGPLMPETKFFAKRLGIESSVRFVGNRLNVSDYYSSFDYFVFPSIFEGLGNVLIESQTAGLHCLASMGVPTDANILGAVSYLPLECGSQSWANYIYEQQRSRGDCLQRESAALEVQGSAFDVQIAASKLCNIYIDLLPYKSSYIK